MRWAAFRNSRIWTAWHLIPDDETRTVCGKLLTGTPAISPPTYDRRSTPKDACKTCVQRSRLGHWDPNLKVLP
jgi:hypothetical protein